MGVERNGARRGLIVLTTLLALAGLICLIWSLSQHSGPVDSFGEPVGYSLTWVGGGLLAFALLGLMLILVVAAVTPSRSSEPASAAEGFVTQSAKD